MGFGERGSMRNREQRATALPPAAGEPGRRPGSHVPLPAAGHQDPAGPSSPVPSLGGFSHSGRLCDFLPDAWPVLRGALPTAAKMRAVPAHGRLAAPSLLLTLPGPCHLATCTPTAPNLQTNSTHGRGAHGRPPEPSHLTVPNRAYRFTLTFFPGPVHAAARLVTRTGQKAWNVLSYRLRGGQ